MARKVKYDWGSTTPQMPEVEATIDRLTDEYEPAPAVSIGVKIKDLPLDMLGAILDLALEHEVRVGVTVEAVYRDGQQLTFWAADEWEIPTPEGVAP